MRFVHPELLWLLLGLPLLAFASWWSARRRLRALQRFAGGPAYVERFRGEVSRHRRLAKLLLLSLAMAALVIAAARPQWGTRLEEVTRRGVDVVIVVDTSLSMAAEDIAPNRLDYAKHAVDTLLKRVEGNRVALVTFAGQATLACPLTLDHAAVRLFLEALEVEATQVPGTALAEALQLGLRALGTEAQEGGQRSRALVLFTDGEDHEGGLDKVVDEIRDSGVSLLAVGCGTTRGAPIPLRTEAGVPTGYKKDRQGQVVTTRLDETLLEKLAADASGRYYRGTPAEAEIDEITEMLSSLDAREFGSVLRARYEERFQFPLGLALLALAGETLLGDKRRAAGPGRRDGGGA